MAVGLLVLVLVVGLLIATMGSRTSPNTSTPVPALVISQGDQNVGALPVGCSANELAALMTRFADSINTGNEPALSSLLSDPIEGITVRRDKGGAVVDEINTTSRGDALDYFRQQHAHHESLQLTQLDVLGEGAPPKVVYVGFSAMRNSDDFAQYRVDGRAGIQCATETISQFVLWNHASGIQPIADAHVTGYVDLERLANGDVRLRVTAQGRSREVYGSNLMWMIATDTCEAWRAPHGQVNPGAVLSRFNADNPQADQPGLQHFSLVIPAEQANPPLVLLAFRNGGGPLLACADLTDLANAGAGAQPIALPANFEPFDADGDRLTLYSAPQPPVMTRQAAMQVVAKQDVVKQYPDGLWKQPNASTSSADTIRAWYGVATIEHPGSDGWWSSQGSTVVWLLDYNYGSASAVQQVAGTSSPPTSHHVVYAVDVAAQRVAWSYVYDSP